VHALYVLLKMNTTLEKLGRVSWMVYLILALPVVVFCVWIDALLIRELFIPDPGPLELPPQTLAVKAVTIVSTTLIPIFWILGLVSGHHFNGRWRAVIPFLGNLLLVTCLAFIIYSVMRAEHNGWDWEFLYLAGLAMVLGFGLVCVIGVAMKNPAEQAVSGNRR
jgi:hypothetical protein